MGIAENSFFNANRNAMPATHTRLNYKAHWWGINAFDQWLIITPDGTHYYFGGTSATEKTYFGING